MKKLFAVGLAVGAGVTSMTLVAPAADAAGCVRSYITTAFHAPTGTVVKKAAGTSCSDLNLVYAYNTTSYNYDRYVGYYRSSNGVWHAGTRGYILAYDGNQSPWVVLVSDLSPGTPMTVSSYYDGPDSVTIAH